MKCKAMDRKEFIFRLGAGSLALSQLGLLIQGCTGREEQKVGVSPSGLVLDGRLYPVYSGSFHYWRHDPALWPGIFSQLSRMGLNTVCTQIPWELHELRPGEFDFGKKDLRKDVGGFIDLAQDKGFKVLVRPGPYLNSELTYGGFPQRILFDPEIAAHTSMGTVEAHHTTAGVFPVPSYCSEKLYRETEIYFDALMPVIAGRLPGRGGPVIGIQADNETSFFSRIRKPYTIDYCPDALRLYRAWLSRKYQDDLDALNRNYGTYYRSFHQVEPPRIFRAERMNDLPPYLDWAGFRQWTVIWSLARISGMFAERGISGIPVFTCLPGDCRAPFCIPETERAEGLDIGGISGFPGRKDYAGQRQLARAAAGMSAFPFKPEFGGGGGSGAGLTSRDAEDVELATLGALMHGIKGLNYYMAVERDRWVGSPVARDGRLRDGLYNMYLRLLRFIRESRFHEFRKKVEILFLFNHGLDLLFHIMEQGKTSTVCLPGEAFAETADLGFRSSPETCLLWLKQSVDLMADVGFDWNYGSTRLDAGRMTAYRIAILPALDFLYRDELDALQEYLNNGGILIFGPGIPYLSERMRSDRDIAAFFRLAEPAGAVERSFSETTPPDTASAPEQKPAGKLVHAESSLEIIQLLKTLDVSVPFTRSNPNLDLSLHESGDRSILFVANTTDKTQASDIFFTGSHRFRSLWDGEHLGGEGKVKVELGPYRIGVWEVSG